MNHRLMSAEKLLFDAIDGDSSIGDIVERAPSSLRFDVARKFLTIFKFLQYLHQEGATQLMRPQTPRNIGLFLITTGTIPLLLAIIQYIRATKRLGKKGPVLLDPNFLAAGVIFLFGSILTLTVVLKISFL